MLKREKIARLQRELKRHQDARRTAVYVDHPWATVEEQRRGMSDILGSIEGSLRRLGVEA